MVLKGFGGLLSSFMTASGVSSRPDEAIASSGAFSDVISFLTALAGDPVKTGDGEFIYEATDISVPGRGQPLSIARRYGSRTDRLGIIGHNWSMPYMEAFLSIWWKEGEDGVDAIVIWWGNGNQTVLIPSTQSPGLFVGVNGDFGNSSFAETHTCPEQESEPPGMIYRDPSGKVKNVSSLSYTSQLRDFAAYAAQNRYTFELVVRESTQLSGPLQQAVSDGSIVLRFLQ